MIGCNAQTRESSSLIYGTSVALQDPENDASVVIASHNHFVLCMVRSGHISRFSGGGSCVSKFGRWNVVSMLLQLLFQLTMTIAVEI
jgi:hypothetical protein